MVRSANGSPIAAAAIAFTKNRSTSAARRLVDDEALGGDAALARVDEARGHAGRGRLFQIRVVQDEIRVAAAELEDALLERGAGPCRHRAAGSRAAGEGDRRDPWIVDDERRRDSLRGGAPGTGCRVTPAALKRSSIASAHPVHVGRMLEQRGVAGQQGRCREAEHLPERKVPRHDRQHGAERLVGDDAPRGVGRHVLGGEEARTVFRVVLARPGALFDLRQALCQRLAHLVRHQHGKVARPAAKLPRDAGQQGGPLGNRRDAPLRECTVARRQRAFELAVGHLVVTGEHVARCGVRGGERHGAIVVHQRTSLPLRTFIRSAASPARRGVLVRGAMRGARASTVARLSPRQQSHVRAGAAAAGPGPPPPTLSRGGREPTTASRR